MAAANTDKFKKLARRWVGSVGTGGVTDAVVTTVPLASATNLPTDTGVVAVIDRVDANGATTSDKEETVIGVVSGSNLTSCTRGAEGTAQAHDAGAVVEILFTNKGWGDLVDGILAEHSQAGAHTTDTISEKTSATGVTVDGVLLKDGGATLTSDLQVADDKDIKFASGAKIERDTGNLKLSGESGKDVLLAQNARARAYASANQENLTNGAVVQVVLDTESYDPGGDFASNEYTVPYTGYYLISAQVYLTSVVALKRYALFVKKNNGATILMEKSAHSGLADYLAIQSSDIIYLGAGDTIELYAHSNSGDNTVDVYGGAFERTWMSIHLLSV